MSWREHWKEIAALARWDAAATLSSPRLWLARYWLPAAVVCVVAAVVLSKGGLPRSLTALRDAGERLGDALSLVYYLLAVIGMPVLVYTAFEEARRSGMLDLLLAAPLARRDILLTILGGRLWTAAHFLLAAVPAFTLAWTLGGFERAGAGSASLGILVGAVCSLSFASLLAVKRVSLRAFAGWQLAFWVFTPAVLPARVWVPATSAFMVWFHVITWPGSEMHELATGLALPLQSITTVLAGRGSNTLFDGALCGAILWSGLVLSNAMRIFPVREAALAGKAMARPRTQSRKGPAHPPSPRRLPGTRRTTFGKLHYLLTRDVTRHQGFISAKVYSLTGKNPFVYRFLLGRENARGWGRRVPWVSAACAAIGMVSLLAITAPRAPGGRFPETMLVLSAFLACHEASTILRIGSSNGSPDLLSGPVRGRVVVVGALASSFLATLWGFLMVPLFPLLENGPAGAAGAFVWITGAIPFAAALGVWAAPARWGAAEKTFLGFAFFVGFYIGIRHLTSGVSQPLHHALMGGSMLVLGIALLFLFAGSFRRLLRASV